MILKILCILFFIPALLITAYYVFLAIHALASKRKTELSFGAPVHNFAIVIPAHNEENTIPGTLESCARLTYPKEKYRIYVIADNCTDRTSDVSRSLNATVLERHNPSNRGKGQALSWAFDQILPQKPDAIIVLDADCLIDSHALRLFDHHLQEGCLVLQANYVVANPDENAISYVIAVGNYIENNMFYAPKSKLNLSVLLRGTGMVFHRQILVRFPWYAHSIVEDVEYSIGLIRNGIRTYFLGNVSVLSDFPVDDRQLRVQRKRWASGNLNLGMSVAFNLIWEGLLKRQLNLLDAGWTLLVLSKPIVLMGIFASFVLSLFCYYFMPGKLTFFLLYANVAIILVQFVYYVAAIFSLGMDEHRILLLLKSPFVLLKLALISLTGILGDDDKRWIKTPR